MTLSNKEIVKRKKMEANKRITVSYLTYPQFSHSLRWKCFISFHLTCRANQQVNSEMRKSWLCCYHESEELSPNIEFSIVLQPTTIPVSSQSCHQPRNIHGRRRNICLSEKHLLLTFPARVLCS